MKLLNIYIQYKESPEHQVFISNFPGIQKIFIAVWGRFVRLAFFLLFFFCGTPLFIRRISNFQFFLKKKSARLLWRKIYGGIYGGKGHFGGG